MKEVNGQVDNQSWELMRVEKVPKNAKIILSVWVMRRKRNLVTNEITKYRTKFNIYKGKQTLGSNYWETYAHVIMWFAIKLMVVCAIVLNMQL